MLRLHIAPVLLGRGERLFEGVGCMLMLLGRAAGRV